MADVKAFERLRPCGSLEKFWAAGHNTDFYNNVGVTVAYSSPSSQHSLQSCIFAALRILINRHAVLSAVPVNEDKKSPFFARLPSIDLRTCTQFIERTTCFFPTEAGERDEELDAILEQQHTTNWRADLGTKPFWKLIVVHSAGVLNELSVSWIFHHALADGVSGLVFHRHLLAALNSFASSQLESDPIITNLPQSPLIPPLEKLHKMPLTWTFITHELWRDTFPKRHPKLWTGGRIAQPPTHRTPRFRTLVFSKETSNVLLEMAREHKTTLSGTLQAIGASAVLANLNAAQHDRVRVDGAYSLRRFLALPDRHLEEEIGTFVSQYFSDHVRPLAATSQSTALELFSWAEAQQVRADIVKELDKRGKDTMIGLIRWISNIHSFFLGKVGQERGESFEVSNIGVWKAKPEEEKGEWTVGRMIFSQDAVVSGAAFEYSIATGRDGCLVIGFTWLEGIVEDELMGKVIGSVQSCVEGLIATKADGLGDGGSGTLAIGEVAY